MDVADNRRITVDRYFGPVDQRLENLRRMLTPVRDDQPTHDELVDWHLDETSAETESGVERRLSFLRTIGILAPSEDEGEPRYQLTDVSRQFLDQNDPRVIFDTLRANVAGFEQILEEMSESGMTDEQVRDILADHPDFDGGSGVAGRHREWLQSLGYVTRDDDTAYLTDAGEALLDDLDFEDEESGPDVAEVWYMNPDDQWDAATEHGITALGWDEVTHVDFESSTDEEINAALEELEGNHPNTPDTINRFLDQMPIGALLVAKTGVRGVYGLGVVTSEYYREDLPDLPEADVHIRDVEWIVDVASRHGDPFNLDWDAEDLDRDQPFAAATLFEFSKKRYRELRRQILEDHPDLEEQFERLEATADGLTLRYQDAAAPDYYWVNQGNENELEGQYLQAPSPHKSWQQILSRVSPGDVVIHHWKGDNEVIGHSTVIGNAEEVELDDGTHQRVPVYFEPFDEPRSVEPVRKYLDNSKFIEATKYYIYTSNHRLQTGYLFDLPDEAGRQIVDKEANFELETYADYFDDLAVPPSEHDVVKENLHFPEEDWDRIRERILKALAEGNHVLLFGPPGTGKTKLARQICEATVSEDGFELVTASADWSTFDTVGGYQTTINKELKFEPGVVLDRFQADEDGTPANEWLIIDELNRADIDKAFSSLFSALSDEDVTLPFDDPDDKPIEILSSDNADEEVSKHRFYIHDDWRMLATMNTLDKTSLYEMSYAFMRRWAFIPIGIPDLSDQSDITNLVAEYVETWANGEDSDLPVSPHHYELVGQIWQAVNSERAIGPAIVEDIYRYVAGAQSPEEADYVSPIIMYIYPQLEGLRRTELEDLIADMGSVLEETDDNTEELWDVARDFFQMPELERPDNRE